MRTCMYCGRELAPGEVCNCPSSVARRAGTSSAGNGGESTSSSANGSEGAGSAENTQASSAPKKKKTTYKTGYAGNDNRFERARNKYNAKKEAKKNAAANADGFSHNLRSFLISALKSPIDAVTNPKHIGKGIMLITSAVMGALLWLCMYFIRRGGAVGPFTLASAAMGFGSGYRLIGALAVCALSGAISGIIIFFIYTGVFYFIDRFIIRKKTPYWSFCERLINAFVPFTVCCLIGTVVSILSPITLAALVACGAASAAVLTYEALRIEWYGAAPSKVFLSMLLGFFVLFTLMGHLIFLGR